MVEYLPVVGDVVESLHDLFPDGNTQVVFIIIEAPSSLFSARWVELAIEY